MMKTPTENSSLIAQLQIILEEEPNTIRAKVAEEALGYSECSDVATFFSDLFRLGCVSGMIGSLVFYSGTHNFFDAHYDEIEELRSEWEDSVGEPLKIQCDLKNTFAWFGFEETARIIASELGLI